MRSRATEEFDEAMKPFKEKSFAAKGFRKTDLPEVMSKPPEGYAPGLGRDIKTGRMFNLARRFTSEVAKPFVRNAGRALAGLSIIGELAEYDNEQKANRKSMQREDISGGPNAEISAKGSPVRVVPELHKADPEDVATAKYAYKKYQDGKTDDGMIKSMNETPRIDDAPIAKAKGSGKKTYRHDLTAAEERKIRNQAISDMRDRANAGDDFWKGQLEKALREGA